MLEIGEAAARFRHLVLVHGVRLGEELSYGDTINQLLAQVGQVSCTMYPLFPVRAGRKGSLVVSPAAIADGRLEQFVGLSLVPEQSQVMICGNPQMVRDTQEILLQRGLRKNLRRSPGEITVEHYW